MKRSWKADAYAQNSKGQAVWAKELIDKLHLQGDETILDIGCGDGKITNYLSELTSKETIGIDKSLEMITFAKTNFIKPVFRQMDAQKLEFENSFDIVFSNAALHWTSDHKAVVNGIYKALKTNGKTILQMGGEGNAKDIFMALEEVSLHYAEYFKGFVSPYTFCSDIYYYQLLQNIGFKKYKAQLIEKEMVHEDIKAFQGWLETTWFPFIDQIPKPLQERFLQEWIERYLTLCPLDAKGQVHIAMVRLEVEATK